MTNDAGSRIPTLLARHEESLLESWMEAQLSAGGTRTDLLSDTELRQQSGEFLRRLRQAAQGGDLHELRGEEWEPVRELIVRLSRNRVIQGFSPGETATFVLSLKQPLFRLLRQEFEGDADRLGQEVWHATVLLDRLGIFTMETYQRSREEIIQRQQQELMELSTPVVKLWEGVVAVPLIGTLDSARTQVVMENLLQRIVETARGSRSSTSPASRWWTRWSRST
jgi:rsbT co-antagonist protein RsbR